MRLIGDALQWIVLTLWVGSLWAVGLIAVPVMFQVLPDKALATMIAGRLFTIVAWLGLGCTLYLLIYRTAMLGTLVLRQPFTWLALVLVAATMLGQFGVQPILASLTAGDLPWEIMEGLFRERFATWHGVASVWLLIESVLGALLVALFGLLS